ncbi:hypothetical protein Tdes44962_MAKER03627 [Teratosphaeria destructans]|uniref:Uncharacterized protein n=1 Tax=Teratosphaeria destructans TaxID=418781 RepID=A0A9W7SQ23_9PEZI|nr:hypothetical protein Tdes44962_MAKER03627 [Teratosphaeria destructans]
MAHHSPLLGLPPELRNHIYEDVLVGDVTLFDGFGRCEDEPALLRTCHQIREEALKLYYSNNFRFCIMYQSDIVRARAWLRSTPTELLRIIPRVCIEPTSNDRINITEPVIEFEDSAEDWLDFGRIARELDLSSWRFIFESETIVELRSSSLPIKDDYLLCRERTFRKGMAEPAEFWWEKGQNYQWLGRSVINC